MPDPGSTPRRRVDIRRLPYGLGYLLAVAVVALVLVLASRASAGRPAPAWWGRYATPAIYYASPLLLAVGIAARVRARRRPSRDPLQPPDRPDT